jgi:hypothetical protein
VTAAAILAPNSRNQCLQMLFPGIEVERKIGEPRKNHGALRTRWPWFQWLFSNADKSISRAGDF